LFRGALIAAALLPSTALASDGNFKPGDVAAWVALAALAPFAVILVSCFVKVAVVLSILRTAFAKSVPPKSVMVAVALLLSLFVMAPVAEKVWAAVEPGLAKGDAISLAAAAEKGREPVRDFLASHAPEREKQSFLELSRHLRPPEERAAVGERDLLVLTPAFVVAELKAAFQVGFLLLLPFLVLELVVASVLTSLGMNGLDPKSVALPFKLLLFVAADGWHLLARGLIQSYG
jgi:type III secretion protein R